MFSSIIADRLDRGEDISRPYHRRPDDSLERKETMEKYTDLEQVLRDPSLVIITDQIATQTELNTIYVKYKILPKKQKRISNYY